MLRVIAAFLDVNRRGQDESMTEVEYSSEVAASCSADVYSVRRLGALFGTNRDSLWLGDEVLSNTTCMVC